MSSAAVATVIRMIESLPEAAQDQVVEHLREYLEDLRDEMEWDGLFKKTRQKLRNVARKAKREITAGKSKPMSHDEL